MDWEHLVCWTKYKLNRRVFAPFYAGLLQPSQLIWLIASLPFAYLQLAAIEGVMKKLLFLSGETTLQIQKVKVLSISCIHQNIFSLEIDNALHLVTPPCDENV